MWSSKRKWRVEDPQLSKELLDLCREPRIISEIRKGKIAMVGTCGKSATVCTVLYSEWNVKRVF